MRVLCFCEYPTAIVGLDNMTAAMRLWNRVAYHSPEWFQGLHELAERGDRLGHDPGAVQLWTGGSYVGDYLMNCPLIGSVSVPDEQLDLASVVNEPTDDFLDAIEITGGDLSSPTAVVVRSAI